MILLLANAKQWFISFSFIKSMVKFQILNFTLLTQTFLSINCIFVIRAKKTTSGGSYGPPLSFWCVILFIIELSCTPDLLFILTNE